ncbi:hypothetical protein GCK72_001273 [Caenorhabditis remanei]|uniref:Uncharacterized protein n=1 Tax=Caenorhabditis remanei TaxID=31234 RepID=A0A6A5HRV8_CAERE|nr:hypothetical protein GCK72_001273 [Caenorhabditis remanei]KAF1769456.1 hypothetical protein GCK72_001273 [Caenorhabditis remanei]
MGGVLALLVVFFFSDSLPPTPPIFCSFSVFEFFCELTPTDGRKMKKLPSLFLILVSLIRSIESLKCYSCASFEYRVLFDKDTSLSRKVRVPKFDRLCDLEEMVQGFAPVETCHSTCVTIFEPQYFGGLQSLQRPFLYIRGCADHIFSEMKDRPIEVEFLHRSPICVKLQLSQIYPQVQANEIVQESEYTISSIGPESIHSRNSLVRTTDFINGQR